MILASKHTVKLIVVVYTSPVETGLYYLNSRYYDPELGRFINADEPTNLFMTAGTPGGANLYAYCLNNPVMMTDSTGCSPFWDAASP